MRTRIFSVIIGICFTQVLLAGGGWPQPKNKGYFKLGQFALVSDQYYAPNGEIVDITTTGIFLTSIYGEYGVTDRLTVIAYVPFFARATLNELVSETTGEVLAEGDELNSFGDTDLSFKYGLIRDKPIVVSATLTLGLPLGNPGGGATGVLQTGDGEFNQMITLDASRSFGNGKTYASIYFGFNNRTKNFSDELRYGAEVGHTFNSKWFVALKLGGVKSLNNGSDLETPSNGIFSNNLEFLSLTTDVAYSVNEKFGISAAFATAFSGKRILAAPAFSLGVFMKL